MWIFLANQLRKRDPFCIDGLASNVRVVGKDVKLLGLGLNVDQAKPSGCTGPVLADAVFFVGSIRSKPQVPTKRTAAP